MKAITTGNPLLLEKMTLDNEVERLKILRGNWQNEHLRLQRLIETFLPKDIAFFEGKTKLLPVDIAVLEANPLTDFSIKIEGRTFTERPAAGNALMAVIAAKCKPDEEKIIIGEYRGLTLAASTPYLKSPKLYLIGEGEYETDTGESLLGNITRIENLADGLVGKLLFYTKRLDELKSEFENAKSLVDKPFEHEKKLKEHVAKQIEINTKLEFIDLEKKNGSIGNEDIDYEGDEENEDELENEDEQDFENDDDEIEEGA